MTVNCWCVWGPSCHRHGERHRRNALPKQLTRRRDGHDANDDESRTFSKGVAALFLKMIDAVMGWTHRSTSATNSDARVKLGVPTSSRQSLPARIEIAVPLGLETFTIVVVVSSDTSLDVCSPSSSRRSSYSRRITTTRSTLLKLERQVKDEARESPVRFLEALTLEV